MYDDVAYQVRHVATRRPEVGFSLGRGVGSPRWRDALTLSRLTVCCTAKPRIPLPITTTYTYPPSTATPTHLYSLATVPPAPLTNKYLKPISSSRTSNHRTRCTLMSWSRQPRLKW
ncbi:hypothetical protein E2C01_021743 [Portunus trituberculatus]|uniref:Uncharacterized protein n=1 Tax=Portunus trituberculatus TaxID=210409 RepID=A0A5B7E5E5_PORTR|nr:hypothetical protein [Portunus trituberculatus]